MGEVSELHDILLQAQSSSGFDTPNVETDRLNALQLIALSAFSEWMSNRNLLLSQHSSEVNQVCKAVAQGLDNAIALFERKALNLRAPLKGSSAEHFAELFANYKYAAHSNPTSEETPLTDQLRASLIERSKILHQIIFQFQTPSPTWRSQLRYLQAKPKKLRSGLKNRHLRKILRLAANELGILELTPRWLHHLENHQRDLVKVIDQALTTPWLLLDKGRPSGDIALKVTASIVDGIVQLGGPNFAVGSGIQVDSRTGENRPAPEVDLVHSLLSLVLPSATEWGCSHLIRNVQSKKQ